MKVVLFKEKLNDTLNERQTKILNILKKNKHLTIENLAKNCQVTELTIKRDLKKLQTLNIIERKGSKKTGHWKITNK